MQPCRVTLLSLNSNFPQTFMHAVYSLSHCAIWLGQLGTIKLVIINITS